MNGEAGDLFGRWSRRKQAVRRLEAGKAAEAAAGLEADQQTPEPAATVSLAPAEPPPSLDDLTAESDLSEFLREGVPAALRNAAMRKMWSLDPAIRDHVGLAENAWDFNRPDAMAGFGPLEAGRAVVNFLSTIVREAPVDPEATAPATDAPTAATEDTASPPQDQPPEPAPVPREVRQDGPDVRPAVETAALRPGDGSPAADPRLGLPRPRHGGAVPR